MHNENRLDLCHGVIPTHGETGVSDLHNLADDPRPIYFFDRSSTSFDVILNVYRNGLIHIPDYICVNEFLEELEFWEIDKDLVAGCCLEKLPEESIPDPISPEDLYLHDKLGITKVANGGLGFQKNKSLTSARTPSRRQRLWQLLEVPTSSKAAMAYMIVSCVLVVITMVVLIISSLPEFQHVNVATNSTEIAPGLEITDAVCVLWFSFDYLLRLFACPNRLIYVKSPLSIIDLAAIFPFYIELLFNYIGIQSGAFGDVRRTLIILRILRVLRVLRALRVLKVARYSSGFQSMGQALKRSWRELTLLIMFTLTANLMFSTAMYYFEVDHPQTHFPSIPAACWWCIITMTTVGYGDVYPKTVAGKILGGLVSITGIILLAFPISVIVETFNEEYQERTNNPGAAARKAAGEAAENAEDLDEDSRPSVLRASAAVVAQELSQSLRMIDGKLYWQLQNGGSGPQRNTAMKRRGKFF